MTHHARLALFALAFCACATPATYEAEVLTRAEPPPPEAELLDVGILGFDPGVAPDAEPPPGVYKQVREAEAVYLPVLLRRTLAASGHWGVVRVLPAPSHNVDLTVHTRILESDGERAALQVRAVDAAGRVWLAKRYENGTSPNAYLPPAASRTNTGAPRAQPDPYQSLLNQIANDLARARAELSADDFTELRRVSELRFAKEFAPDAFADYLQERGARFRVKRLPAESDPSLQRVRDIRTRDALFVDTLNEHYDLFYEEMRQDYLEWRKVAREEKLNYLELKRTANRERALAALLLAGSVAAGGGNSETGDTAALVGTVLSIEVFLRSFETNAEAQLHQGKLEELGESFNAEVTPMVVRIAGDEARLTGNASAQYAQWKEFMQRLYQLETALGEQELVLELDTSAASPDEPR